ncbi:histone-lysine N-methyltransferase SMYD3-like [Branchiostoma lanceolatum]|uniref:histone-lysine N-methyltransferase SMYD3-like n=1 Tax=Branchiostoma lanceolatum TaxID=7740 RepID=UPI003455F91C
MKMADGVEIFSSAEKGRGLCATKVFKPGNLVRAAEPYAYVLCNSERGKRCDFCFARKDDMSRCSGCKFARYCDGKCQKAAWTEHKSECKSIKTVKPETPTDSIRLIARIINKTKTDGPGVPGNSIDELQSNLREMPENVKEMFAQLAVILRMYVGRDVMDDAREIFELFGRMTCNTFSICDSEMQYIGIGIYPKMSLFNHSCAPNCVAVFNGLRMEVRAIQTIQPGEELLISYVEMLALSKVRKQQLLQQYYFTCRCPSCQDQTKDGMMMAVKCGNINCKKVIIQVDGAYETCKECGHDNEKDPAFFKEVNKVTQFSEEMLEAVTSADQRQEPKEGLRLAERLLERQQKVLHNNHLFVLKCLDKALDQAVVLRKWNRALRCALQTIEPYKVHFPAYHPSLGIQYMRIGKLLLYLEKRLAALEALQMAEHILNVTHGKDHPINKELGDLLTQCMDEMRMYQAQKKK